MRELNRRGVIGLVGGAAAAWPLRARAQHTPPMIGYFSNRSQDAETYLLQFFSKGLAAAGFVIDQSAAIDLRLSDGREDLLPGLAADLVRRQVSVLVANDPLSALAAKAATSTIPIVFASGRDPVELGLVASLNRPTGNATGVYGFVDKLGPKRLHLMRELVPAAKVIAFVVTTRGTADPRFQVQDMLAAGQAIGQDILIVNASNESEVDAAFATVIEHKASGIIFAANTWFQVIGNRLVALAARHAIPAVYEWREFVGSRHKISETFIAALHEDFVQHGACAIQRVREERPADYVRVVASLIPKELHVQSAPLEDMSDDELMDIIALLRSHVAKGTGEATEH
jgi:putative ABC transport system substrate-binding protein